MITSEASAVVDPPNSRGVSPAGSSKKSEKENSPFVPHEEMDRSRREILMGRSKGLVDDDLRKGGGSFRNTSSSSSSAAAAMRPWVAWEVIAFILAVVRVSSVDSPS